MGLQPLGHALPLGVRQIQGIGTGGLTMTWLNSAAVQKFHDDLAEIPTLYADLPAILTGIKGQSGGVHTPPGSKPPLAVHVVDLLDTRVKGAQQWRTETDPRGRDVLDRYGVIPRVGLWVRLVGDEADEAGEHPFDMDDADWTNLEALCKALKAATSWLIMQQWVTELAQDMAALRAEMRSTLGIRPEFIPKCRYCRNKTEPQDGGTWFRCPACGADFTWQGEVQALIAVQDMTGKQCAEHLGLAWPRIRKWDSLGLLKSVGQDARGRKLYSLDAVARVQRDIAARRITLKEA